MEIAVCGEFPRLCLAVACVVRSNVRIEAVTPPGACRTDWVHARFLSDLWNGSYFNVLAFIIDRHELDE